MIYILLAWLLAPLWWPISLLRRWLCPQPQRILIAEIAGIGDIVCSAHLLKQLRQRYPGARIDLVIDPIGASLSPLLAMIDNVIQFPYVAQKGLTGRLRFTRLCMGYDTGISLIPSAAQLTGFCLAAMPRRFSVLPSPLKSSYRFLRPLLTGYAIHVSGRFFVETQGKLFSLLGLLNPKLSKWLPPLDGARPIDLQTPAINVGLLISSGRELKRVSLEKLAEIITALQALAISQPVNVVLIGGPTDRALAESLLSMLPANIQVRTINAVGQYSLAELPALLSQLSVLVGVDSGVTHMADALQIPVVCIAGPVDLAEVYQPGATRALLKSTVPCYPCSTVFDTPTTCRTGDLACMRTLTVSTVLQAVDALLKGKGT